MIKIIRKEMYVPNKKVFIGIIRVYSAGLQYGQPDRSGNTDSFTG
jgi:hypothetical protein